MNKKAISPVVSTVIMLGFAIALGIIVIGWGEEIEQKTYLDCDKVRIELVIIDNEPVLCYNNEGLDFMIENRGSIDIKGFKLNIIGDKDISKVEIEQSIKIGDVVKMTVPYDRERIGNIKLLKFFGMVNKNYCGDSLLEINKIKVCK